MTIIRFDDAEAAAALFRHLRGQQDLAVEWAAPNRLRVSVLGSYSDEAMRLELTLRLRAWQEAERARGRQAAVIVDED